MQYPRVKPNGDIRCGARKCHVIFYEVPGGRPFIIACPERKCANRPFLRAETAEEVEERWCERRDRVKARGSI